MKKYPYWHVLLVSHAITALVIWCIWAFISMDAAEPFVQTFSTGSARALFCLYLIIVSVYSFGFYVDINSKNDLDVNDELLRELLKDKDDE